MRSAELNGENPDAPGVLMFSSRKLDENEFAETFFLMYFI